jgi:hypothetical protein
MGKAPCVRRLLCSDQTDDGWCGALRCLIESKAVDPELLKRLGINLERLSECCQTEKRPVIARQGGAASAQQRRRNEVQPGAKSRLSPMLTIYRSRRR